MIIQNLNRLFDLCRTIYFEGKLYEDLFYGGVGLDGVRYKYREILSEDDYDYVVDTALKKRLDRVFARLYKENRR